MPNLNVGGQAVIEGVMMRSEDKIATAVRKPNGEILVSAEDYKSLSQRYKILGWPILRGAISFVEMLFIGIRTLNFSAEVAVEEMEKEEAEKEGREYTKEKKKKNAVYLWFTAAFAMIIGLGLFLMLPIWLSSLLGLQKDALPFNLVAGGIRLSLFLVYMIVISLFGEFKRIFEYHGAEHKSIYALEMGDELLPERAACHTRFHPRCGTSFVLIVALLAIMVYALADTIFAWAAGAPLESWFLRTLYHLAILPVVAGTSYELLKLSGKTRDSAITKILIQPGLWLQKITTREPSMDQLEVAIAALKAALGLKTETQSISRSAAAS
jgi:uncharacterized protein YqhQ